jgi:hypothetical protein
MTQPEDTRIRLLTAMGWKQERRICDVGFIVSTDEERDGWLAPGGECWHEGEYLLPQLDANLLAAARDQLLTTEELWHSYLFSLELELPSFKDGRYSFCKTAFLAPITTHCEALLSALERNKITQEQARAILAVKEAHV